MIISVLRQNHFTIEYTVNLLFVFELLFFFRIEHREEGHRIIREFLIGPQNMNYILNQDKRKVE